MPSKNLFFGVITFVFVFVVSLVAAEGVVRLKNLDQKNYNIEMWRYSNLLKMKSDNPDLGHVHRADVSARLEGVKVRLNRYGLRGPEIDLSQKKKKILFLGSSNTLGWGVPEENTMTSVLERELGPGVCVMNGGIGNYNTLRYVTLFKEKLRALRPDVVVVHYFIRDAETLPPGRTHFILRHSELAVLAFSAFQQALNTTNTLEKLTRYYEVLYEKDAPGYRVMVQSLAELKRLSEEDGFKVILAMAPEIHQMKPYPFKGVHERMGEVARSFGWQFVDLYAPLSVVPSQELWAMAGDPHINAKGHHLMAEALRPSLES